MRKLFILLLLATIASCSSRKSVVGIKAPVLVTVAGDTAIKAITMKELNNLPVNASILFDGYTAESETPNSGLFGSKTKFSKAQSKVKAKAKVRGQVTKKKDGNLQFSAIAEPLVIHDTVTVAAVCPVQNPCNKVHVSWWVFPIVLLILIALGILLHLFQKYL